MKLTKNKILLLVGSLVVIALFILSPLPKILAQTVASVTGYAWSDGMGFIGMDSDSGGGSVTFDPATGNLSGYAWSGEYGGSYKNGYIGFINMSGVKVPVAGGKPVAGGPVTGTAQVCSVLSPGCIAPLIGDEFRGGWDGVLEMYSDAKVSADGKTLTGHAWTNQNTKFIDLTGLVIDTSAVLPNPTLTVQNCAPGVTVNSSPSGITGCTSSGGACGPITFTPSQSVTLNSGTVSTTWSGCPIGPKTGTSYACALGASGATMVQVGNCAPAGSVILTIKKRIPEASGVSTVTASGDTSPLFSTPINTLFPRDTTYTFSNPNAAVTLMADHNTCWDLDGTLTTGGTVYGFNMGGNSRTMTIGCETDPGDGTGSTDKNLIVKKNPTSADDVKIRAVVAPSASYYSFGGLITAALPQTITGIKYNLATGITYDVDVRAKDAATGSTNVSTCWYTSGCVNDTPQTGTSAHCVVAGPVNSPATATMYVGCGDDPTGEDISDISIKTVDFSGITFSRQGGTIYPRASAPFKVTVTPDTVPFSLNFDWASSGIPTDCVNKIKIIKNTNTSGGNVGYYCGGSDIIPVSNINTNGTYRLCFSDMCAGNNGLSRFNGNWNVGLTNNGTIIPASIPGNTTKLIYSDAYHQ